MTPANRRRCEIVATALLLSLALGSVLIVAAGQSPWRVWSAMLTRTLGDRYALGQVLYKATTLTFTGLAVGLALDAGLFNIGGEAQLIAGNLAAAVVGAALPAALPRAIALPAAVAAAMATGAIVGAVIGVLRAFRGAHEVITSILLNAIVAGVALWIGSTTLFVAGTTRSTPIISNATLPELGLSGSAANASIVLAILAVLVVWWLRQHSRWGLAWRAVGRSASGAEGAGVSLRSVRVWIMAASGALAGLGASNLVLGHKHAFEEGLGRGTGYLGVAVAVLGRAHPIGIAIAALGLGLLSHGGLVVADLVPKETTEVMIAIVMISVAVAAPLVDRLAKGRRP